MGRIKSAIKNFANGDTIASFGNNIFALIKGPVVTVLVAMYLSADTQGYWYTFGSIAALSVFADLGFATIVGQFASHEMAHLSFGKGLRIEGVDESVERISSLYKFVMKWAALVVLVAYPIIIVVGFVILNTHENTVAWEIPWLIFALTSGVSFLVSVTSSFFTGCGQIKKTQVRNIITNVVAGVVTIIGLVLGWGLYSLALSTLISMVVGVGIQLLFFGRPIIQMLTKKLSVKFPWGKSFLRLIWKYALSWCSGYFIFQIYTPLAFLVYDPVLAGKVGITLTLCQACYSIASTTFFVLTPKINMAVADREWAKGRRLTKIGTVASLLLFGLGATAILLGLGIFQAIDTPLQSLMLRFLPAGAAAFLLSAWFLQIPINSIATYGRAFKEEPFVWVSIINAVCTAGSTAIIVFTLPIDFLFMGFALTNLMGLIVFYIILRKGEMRWQDKLIGLQTQERAIVDAQRGFVAELNGDAVDTVISETAMEISVEKENIENTGEKE